MLERLEAEDRDLVMAGLLDSVGYPMMGRASAETGVRCCPPGAG